MVIVMAPDAEERGFETCQKNERPVHSPVPGAMHLNRPKTRQHSIQLKKEEAKKASVLPEADKRVNIMLTRNQTDETGVPQYRQKLSGKRNTPGSNASPPNELSVMYKTRQYSLKLKEEEAKKAQVLRFAPTQLKKDFGTCTLSCTDTLRRKRKLTVTEDPNPVPAKKNTFIFSNSTCIDETDSGVVINLEHDEKPQQKIGKTCHRNTEKRLRGKGNLTGIQAGLHTSEVRQMYKTDQPSQQIQKEETKKTSVLCTLPSTETLKRNSSGTEGPGKKNMIHHSKSFPEEKNTSGILTNGELNKLCEEKGRISSVVKTACNKICSYIRSQYEGIVHVYPAYKLADDNKIIFAVFSKKEITIFQYEVELKVLHQNDEESQQVMSSKESKPLPIEQAKEISGIIDKNAETLIKKHQYLSAITAGSFRYRRNSKGYQEIVEGACIVLYVLAKDVIPLNEKAFQRKLDGIPVDVREGGFNLCGGPADKFQENLCMGCTITSDNVPAKYGTLGGFIEHPLYGLCGFTCAHIFLLDKDNLALKARGKVAEEVSKFSVYQPSCSFSDTNKIGPLVEMTYKEGDNKPGVDLALFKIERRTPITGNFPDDKGNDTQKGEQELSYLSGFVWTKSGLPSHEKEVLKFGQTSKQTFGEILFDNIVVRDFKFKSRLNIPENIVTTTLNKQYQIKPKNGQFCELGDSGALVFMKDTEQNDLRCNGMVVGIMPDNTGVVTPIEVILEELNVSELKSFTFGYTLDRMDAGFTQIKEELKNTRDGIRDDIRKLSVQSQCNII